MMTNTYRMQPRARRLGSLAPRSALICVWTETGDPRQTLACVWRDADMRAFGGADRRPEVQAEDDSAVPLYRYCA